MDVAQCGYTVFLLDEIFISRKMHAILVQQHLSIKKSIKTLKMQAALALFLMTILPSIRNLRVNIV